MREAAATRTPLRIVGRGSWLDGGHPTSPGCPTGRPERARGHHRVHTWRPHAHRARGHDRSRRSRRPRRARTNGCRSTRSPSRTTGFHRRDDRDRVGWSARRRAWPPARRRPGDGSGHGGRRVIRTGGRVVKNVAGFDLTRLMTGAWGTLGVLTEVTVRLRGRPVCDETWSSCGAAHGRTSRARRRMRTASPIFCRRSAQRRQRRLLSRCSIAAWRLGWSCPGRRRTCRACADHRQRRARGRRARSARGDRRRRAGRPTDLVCAPRSEPGPARVPPLAVVTDHRRAGASARTPLPPVRRFPTHSSMHPSAAESCVPSCRIRDPPHSPPRSPETQRTRARSPEPLSRSRRVAGIRIPERLPPWLWGAVGRAVGDPAVAPGPPRVRSGDILNPGVLGEEIERGEHANGAPPAGRASGRRWRGARQGHSARAGE